MSINKTLFQQKLDELKRAGNERRLRELQSKYQCQEIQIIRLKNINQ